MKNRFEILFRNKLIKQVLIFSKQNYYYFFIKVYNIIKIVFFKQVLFLFFIKV